MDSVVDYCSGAYAVGGYGGTAIGLAIPVERLSGVGVKLAQSERVRGVMGRVGKRLADESGSIDLGASKFAKKLKLSPTSPAVSHRHLTVDDFIGKFRKGSVRNEIPGEFLGQTVEEALRSGNTTVRKLLTDGRFAK